MTDRSVVVRLKADIAGFKAQLASASASVKDTGDKMTGATKEGAKFRKGLDTVGNTARNVGLVAAVGLGAAVKAAMDWETAWAGVTKTVDGSTSQMAALETGLRNLATTLPATHDEIAGIAEAAGQLGVAREDIIGFTRTMVDLGETTNLTAEEAATSIAQISNVMGTMDREGSEGVARFGAALVALGNDGASTEAQILQMAQRIAGTGAQIGLVESEILAIANAAASMGIEAEAGGSSISRVFTEMAKAAAQGGPRLEEFARTAGMTGDEFTRAFGEDPAAAFASFTTGLDRVNKSGGDVFTVLDKLGLSDVRVSQALLSMAASGDLLTDSLELGKSAWEDNTALALEAAKRYDTTASQVQVSWNRIKDAGIDAGEALLPVVAKVADSVGGIADAFGELPGPAKAAATNLAGITAVLGGGLWFGTKVIGGITSAREAMDNLGASSGKAGGALSKVGRGATIAVAGLAGLAVIDALQVGFGDAAIGMEAMTKSLVGLKGGASSLPVELDGIADSIDRLANPNSAQALQDNLSAALGGIGGGSELRDAKAQIEALDAALTNLVTSAGVDTAASALDDLASSAGLSKSEFADLTSLLPGYKEAVTGAENETALLAAASSTAAGGTNELATAATAASQAAEEFKATIDSLNAVLSGRANLRDYEAALDDFTASIKENGKSFDITTEKGRANQAGLDNIASTALKVAENMSEVDRQAFLSGKIAEIRAMAREMDLPKAQVRALIALLKQAHGTKAQPEAEVIGAEESMRRVKALDTQIKALRGKIVEAKENGATESSRRVINLRERIRDLHDKKITITTDYHGIRTGFTGPRGPGGGGQGQVAGNADGATVQGPRHPYGDKVLTYLAPGEEVISNRYGQADRNRALLKAISAGRMANGGTVGRATAAPSVSVAAPRVNVGGTTVTVLIDGQQFRGMIVNEIEGREEMAGMRGRAGG